jgi:hypothetical protein
MGRVLGGRRRSQFAAVASASIGFLLASASDAGAAADASWIAVVGSDTRPLASGPGQSSFALQLAGLGAGDTVGAELTLVTKSGQPFAIPDGLLTTEVRRRAGYSTLADLTLKVTRNLGPGIYDVQLLATASNKAKAATAFTVHLVVAGAQVRAPATVYVDALIPPWDLLSDRGPRAERRIELELAGATTLTNMIVTGGGAAVMDGHDTPGRVSVVTAQVPVAGSHPPELTLLADEFALGTSSGSLRVAADQLAEPLELRYEVRVRRSTGVVWLLMLLGIVVGLLVREVLAARAEKGEKAGEASQLLARMRQARAATADVVTRNAIDAAQAALLPALDQSTAELSAALAAQSAALDEALKLLTARRIDADAQVTLLRRLTTTLWNLPSSMAGVVTQAGSDLAPIQRFLDIDDVKGASDAIGVLRERLQRGLSATAPSWAELALNDMERLPPVPEAYLHGGEQAAKDVAQSLRAVMDESRRTALDPERVLQAVHTGRFQLSDHLARVLAALDGLLVGAAAVFAERRATRVFEPLRKDFASVRPQLAETPGDLELLLGRVRTGFDEGFSKALAAVPGATARAMDKAAPLLVAGQYLDAAKAFAAALPPQPENMGTREAARPQSAPLDAPAVPVPAPQSVPPARLFPMPAVPDSELEQLVVNRVIRTGKQARVVQRAIVAVLLMTTGYGLYAPAFVGRLPELLTIFFWAFSLNVGIDTLLAQSKTIGKPG